mmetsp:Transcript_15644/g.20678  ORF Transcript_15644/g.20678 Transcript_15644/m.20678 type:complete len:237 (-) Transcript_15644:283-993(-)
MHLSILVLLLYIERNCSLSFFNTIFKTSTAGKSQQELQLENDAIIAARGDDNNAFLRSIEALESTRPTAKGFVEDPTLSRQLDGTWQLIGTLAAKVGEDLNASAQRGVVNASGIVVDADSEKNKPIQIIDIDQAIVRNEVRLSILNKDVIVCVSGAFAPFDRKVNVDFEEIEILDAETRNSIFKNRWLFTLIRTFNRKLINGEQESAWLETTYLSDRLRIGRGNKGSCFLLEKIEE